MRFNKRKMIAIISFLSFLSVIPLFLTGSPVIRADERRIKPHKN